MAEKVIMPKAGMSMETGTIIQWYKKVGDKIEKGDEILEIETDKLSMPVEAEDSGTLLKILYPEGAVVPVVQTIAWIGTPGEVLPEENGSAGENSAGTDIGKIAQNAGNSSADFGQNNTNGQNNLDGQCGSGSAVGLRQTENGKILATPAARQLAKEQGICLCNVVPSGRSGEIVKKDVENALVAGFSDKSKGGNLGVNVSATPLARQVAQANGIDLSLQIGTGPGGKIYQRDLLHPISAGVFNANAQNTAVSDSASSVQSSGKNSADNLSAGKSSAEKGNVRGAFAPLSRKRSAVAQEPLKGMRKIIAERMLETHQTVPSATLRIEVDVESLANLRAEFNRVHQVKITFNDLVLRATALALDEFPALNAAIQGNNVIYNERIHLGVAMAVENGLLVPVVPDANERSLWDISTFVKDLGTRAKANRLKPDELTGGTFTVTNLGMYGIDSFTPIINLPQVAILGVCAIIETPVVKNGAIVPGKRMGLCLTHDHRLIDGALGASFLQRVKQLLESPISLL